MLPSSLQKTTNSCAFRSAHPPSQLLSLSLLFPFFFFSHARLEPGPREAEARHRSPSSSPPPNHRSRAREASLCSSRLLSSPADPPGCSPSVTFCAGAGGWLGWSERSPRGRGRRKVKPRERQETPFITCVAGRARGYLFIFSLFIDRTSRAARGAGGDAGPPTGGEAASRPPAPPRCRAPPASALRRLPATAPAPARAPAPAPAPPRHRRRQPGRPAAPQPHSPAPPGSGPGDSGGAVSWQEPVPSVLASPAPFELVAAARLACAWLLEGEKEEGSTEGWGKGKKSSLELYLCSLGASDSAARELLSLLFPFRVHGEEKVSMQLSPGAHFARYVPRARRVLRGGRCCCCRRGGGGCQLPCSVTVTLHLS